MRTRSIRCFSLVASVSLTLMLAPVGCGKKRPEGATGTGNQAAIPEPPSEGEPTGGKRLRTVYVPAYSHLRSNRKPYRFLLAILLSVRNIDSSAVITLTHVDYFNTSGRRVRRYLSSPRTLRPLETAEFTVDVRDDAGGSGANFLVYWEGPSDAHPLLTEAVMWGRDGIGYVSFASRGIELKRRPNPKTFVKDDSMSPPKTPVGDASADAP